MLDLICSDPIRTDWTQQQSLMIKEIRIIRPKSPGTCLKVQVKQVEKSEAWVCSEKVLK